jgi:hypothetical protein
MDKLSKFLNLTTVDMKKLKGGNKMNFSDLLDDVTFIDPAANEGLRIASYQKDPKSSDKDTTSFDIVDVISQSIESPAQPKQNLKL